MSIVDIDIDRRRFLARVVGAAGGAFLGSGKLLRTLAAPSGEASSRSLVLEIRFTGLRGESGRINAGVLQDTVFVASMALVEEKMPPLDALSELFADDPPVTVLVHARAGSSVTPAIAMRLATGLVEMGCAPETVRVLDASDADLVAGGYELTRQGSGPMCVGTQPSLGYVQVKVPDTRRTVKLSRGLEGAGRRLGVVGSLSADSTSASTVMRPFVIDAALRSLDEGSRAEAVKDPEFGAKLLAGPLFGERIGIVIGDLVEVRVQGSETRSASPTETLSSFKADEILAGRDLFAVERIGHRILSNTCVARGKPAPPQHPILEAAESLGLRGARMTGVEWRKASL